jgi:hypothetical protein
MAGEFTATGEKMILRARSAMAGLARVIMTESLVECPIDTGTLRASAGVSPVMRTPTTLTVDMGYGYGGGVNPKTGHPVSDYAIPVHEIVEKYHAPPTKSHFLLDPVMANAPNFKFALMGALNLDVPKKNIMNEMVLSFEGHGAAIQVANLPQRVTGFEDIEAL